MPIAATDIKFYKSTFTNGVTISLGGAIDTSVALGYNQDPSNPIYNQVFRDFTNSERDDGTFQHHAIFVKNTHATLTATVIKLWFSAVTPNPDTLARMGLSGTGKNQDAVTISNIHGTPTGVDFDTRHNDKNEAIVLPDLGPGEYIAFWIRVELRPNSPQYNKDWFQIRIDFNTPT